MPAEAKVRVAIAGCGNVSANYLENLRRSPHAVVTSVCDTRRDRAELRAAEFGIPRASGSIEELLAGPEFDLLVNLTAMPSHFAVNLAALETGRHVLCEKPIATTNAEAQRLLRTARGRGARLFGAPNVVTSPAFRCLAELLTSGEIGRVHAARGLYGYEGPSWGPWFYRRGGGVLFDLGVYNLTFLTGLLGPARAVTALTGIAVPDRTVEGELVQVEAEDNAAVLLDHGDSVFSVVQTGFVYGPHREERTVELIGTAGSACLLGWDWEPHGIEVRSSRTNGWELRATDQQGYHWAGGASYIAECLATGCEPLMTAEHPVHVLELMLAAQESSAIGRRVEIHSRFPWPVMGV
jgi:predicted dehydrogenase